MLRPAARIPRKPSQQPLVEEDEATILRRRMEEQISQIKKQIKHEFQKEISNDPTENVAVPKIILPDFQRELHLLQAYNQRNRATLNNHEQGFQNLMNEAEAQTQFSEDTQVSQEQAQTFLGFSKKSYQSTTSEFFPVRSEYQVKDMREKLNTIREQLVAVDKCIVAEEENQQVLHESHKDVQSETQRIKHLVEQREKQLNQLTTQEEDTYSIMFQATEKKKETQRTLNEIIVKIKQIDQVETRYKEKKQQILDELRKDNDFYENTLSKLRLQIVEREQQHKELEQQLREIQDKEESRNKATYQQNEVTDYMMAMQKLEKYFLDGEIYTNPEQVEEFKQLHEEPVPKELRSARSKVMSTNLISFSTTLPRTRNKNKSTTFLTSVEPPELESQGIITYRTRAPSPEKKVKRQIRFTVEDQLRFFKSIEHFAAQYPDGIDLLATGILREFRELTNENGVLEKLYCFLIKQIEANNQLLEELGLESQECQKQYDFAFSASKELTTVQSIQACLLEQEIALDSGLMDGQTGKITVNQMRRDNQDINIHVQHTIDRKNKTQVFSFQVFFTLVESLNRLCNILVKVQEQTQLVPPDFEKQYQSIFAKLNLIKLSAPHRQSRKKQSTVFVEEDLDGPMDQQLTDTLKRSVRAVFENVRVGTPTLEEYLRIAHIHVENLINDYVCKTFIQADKINKFAEQLFDGYKSFRLVHDVHDLVSFEKWIQEAFQAFHNELHSTEQSNIKLLLNMNVLLIKQLLAFRQQLMQTLDAKEPPMLKSKEKSLTLSKYMHRASMKLLSYFDSAGGDLEEPSSHRQTIDLQLAKKGPIAAHDFIMDLNAISRARRKVASKPQKGLHLFFVPVPISEKMVTEEEQFENERHAYKSMYEQKQHSSALEERQRMQNERFETQRRNLVFNRLSTAQGQNKHQSEERDHLRQLSKNNEVLFKIKQLDQHAKKLGKEQVIYDLNQERLQKEKLFKREFKHLPSTKQATTIPSRPQIQVTLLEDDQEEGESDKGNQPSKRPSVSVQGSDLRKKKSITQTPLIAGIESRPRTQQTQQSNRNPAISVPQVEPQHRLSKFAMEGMVPSPYIKSFISPRSSFGALTRFFTKDQINKFQQEYKSLGANEQPS